MQPDAIDGSVEVQGFTDRVSVETVNGDARVAACSAAAACAALLVAAAPPLLWPVSAFCAVTGSTWPGRRPMAAASSRRTMFRPSV